MNKRAKGNKLDFTKNREKDRIYIPPKAIRLEDLNRGLGACNPGSVEASSSCHDGEQAPNASCHLGGYAGSSCSIGSAAGNCNSGSVPQ